MKPTKEAAKTVAVVGGGVVGLTTALVLSRTHRVTVIAERMGILSNSLNATAIWHVYLVPETPTVLAWAQRSLEILHHLSIDEAEAGVELVTGVELFRHGNPTTPSWSHIPRVFKMLTDLEIETYNSFDTSGMDAEDTEALRRHPVIWGYLIEAPAADMMKYLTWLQRRVEQNAVKLESRRIESLDELSSAYDVIVNCSGFGARELTGDKDFVPYKGQYFVLRATPSSPRAYVGDDDHPNGMAYMIPRGGEVMVGGCAEMHVEDLTLSLDWADTMKRAGLYVPWLRGRSTADQARSPVSCIRPCRGAGVRLEIDFNSAKIPVVHNYGHGGSGFSLSWGCAEAVSGLVESI